jgi:hypothetical protein
MGRGRGWGDTSEKGANLATLTPTQPSPIEGEGFDFAFLLSPANAARNVR